MQVWRCWVYLCSDCTFRGQPINPPTHTHTSSHIPSHTHKGVFTPFKNNPTVHSEASCSWIQAYTYIMCMHGHTSEAITHAHTHTYIETAEHTWLLGSHPHTLCSHCALHHWRLNSHTQSHTRNNRCQVSPLSRLSKCRFMSSNTDVIKILSITARGSRLGS